MSLVDRHIAHNALAPALEQRGFTNVESFYDMNYDEIVFRAMKDGVPVKARLPITKWCAERRDRYELLVGVYHRLRFGQEWVDAYERELSRRQHTP